MSDIVRFIKNIYHLFQAIAAVCYYRYPAKKLTVIGVTGTDGKTTTSTLIFHILKSSGYKVALISTVAAYIGKDQIDTGFHVTSPDSFKLQKLLRRIVNEGYSHIVLEATSHGLDQHRLLGANIKVAVVTNITHEHLDYHHTLEKYIHAKAKIFARAEFAILNADDAAFNQLIKYVPKKCKIYLVSRTENSNPNLLEEEDYRQLQLVIKTKFKESYNQSNALAAYLTITSLGLSKANFSASLPSFEGVPGRMQRIPNSGAITVFVDFAHTPNALKEALTAARQLTKHKLIVVFGAAGLRDKTKRPLMGKIAAELADEIILTAEDPRGEDVRLITRDIKAGAIQNHGHLHDIPDRLEAIKCALKWAKPGDTVIICGKGHEQSMNLDGKLELPWSDGEVVTKLLNSHV